MSIQEHSPGQEVEVMQGTAPMQRAGFRLELQQEDLQTLKDTYAKDLTESEFRLFVAVSKERGLNPLNKQIHAIVRGKDEKRTLSFQTSIDSFRLIAERTGRYAGQTPQQWCGADGIWKDVWLDKEPPKAARCGVYKKGFVEPLFAVALYDEYVQKDYSGKPNSMWSKMPVNQLSKCAEALSLRKSFPEDLSGIYTDDEMGQADNSPRISNSGIRSSVEKDEIKGIYYSLTPERQEQFRNWYKSSNYPVGATLGETFDNMPEPIINTVLVTLRGISQNAPIANPVGAKIVDEQTGEIVEVEEIPEEKPAKPTNGKTWVNRLKTILVEEGKRGPEGFKTISAIEGTEVKSWGDVTEEMAQTVAKELDPKASL